MKETLCEKIMREYDSENKLIRERKFCVLDDGTERLDLDIQNVYDKNDNLLYQLMTDKESTKVVTYQQSCTDNKKFVRQCIHGYYDEADVLIIDQWFVKNKIVRERRYECTVGKKKSPIKNIFYDNDQTIYYYDEDGKLEFSFYIYNGEVNIKTKYYYNDKGQLIKQIDRDYDYDRDLEYIYDDNGRLVAMNEYDKDNGDIMGKVYYHYDGCGNCVCEENYIIED
jgi:YD repeat-containing protein